MIRHYRGKTLVASKRCNTTKYIPDYLPGDAGLHALLSYLKEHLSALPDLTGADALLADLRIHKPWAEAVMLQANASLVSVEIKNEQGGVYGYMVYCTVLNRLYFCLLQDSGTLYQYIYSAGHHWYTLRMANRIRSLYQASQRIVSLRGES